MSGDRHTLTGDWGPCRERVASGYGQSPVRTDGGEEWERDSRIEALHRAAAEIGSATTVETACERTVETAAEVLDFALCSVLLCEEGMLVPKALSEDAPEDGARPMEPTQGLAGHTYQTGESTVIEDTGTADKVDPAKESYRSALSVPVGDRGVFQAVAGERRAFDDRDRRLADLLTSHTASALERVRREQRLREKNQRLKDFAGLVSHDLRNPLHLAYGRTELALETGDLEHVEVARSALERMDDIIADLLVLAREGEVASETAPIDVCPFAERVWDDLDTRDATLTVETDLTVESSETHLRHLFENLFENAIDHAPGPDQESLTVSVGLLDDREGFFVADDGVGIDTDRRDSVFEAGVTSDREGTGFGLRVVEELARANGWTVEVTESADGGARFEVETG